MGATVVGKNLTKTYNLGDQMLYALNDVSLEVYPGEMVAIIGRTGSGKSTLLHTLGCLQRPDSGRVLLEDLDVTQLEDEELARVRAQKVGFIFQAFNLLPNETAATNVEVALWDEGMSPRDRRRRVLDALTAVGLGIPAGPDAQTAFDGAAPVCGCRPGPGQRPDSYFRR